MRSALCIVVTVLVTTSVSTIAGGQVASKTEVSGYSDYLLGADQNSVLATHPSLKPGARPITDKLPVTSYYGETQMPASFGSIPNPEMTLHFWKGKLAVTKLNWSPSLFTSRSQLRLDAEVLEKVLVESYDRSLFKFPLGWLGSLMSNDIQDARGNTIHYFASDETGISIEYLWGPFDAADRAAPAPPSKF